MTPASSRPMRYRAQPVLAGISAHMLCLAIAFTFAAHATASIEDAQLPEVDRYLLDEWVGYSPPTLTEDIRWHPADLPRKPDWWSFHEQIVVVQSFSHADAASTSRLREIADQMKEFSPFDVQFIALHTPEKAKELDEKTLDEIRQLLPERALIAVDPTGELCDKLGIFRHPTNLVLNREGVVTEVGLSPTGAARVVEQWLDVERGATGSAEFPAATGDVRGARDVRGQKAPEVHVQQWANGAAQCDGKLTLVKFWRTGCPHCINALPHLNNLARDFGDDLCIVAITQENQQQLSTGLSRRNWSLDRLNFSVAIDSSRRMSNALQLRSVPHALLISTDGIARWQGHPAQLTDELLEQFIAADRGGQVVRPRVTRRVGGNAEFPPATGDVGGARDVRGEKAPEVHVQQWMNGQARCEGKLTMVKFWRTGCPHCINAIPHLNSIARDFGDDLCIVAITQETEQQVQTGLSRRNMSVDQFQFNVAIDTSRRMASAVQLRGVPHALIMCSEGIVRWQGHPARLTNDILEQIIAADRMPAEELPRDRWQKRLAASR